LHSWPQDILHYLFLVRPHTLHDSGIGRTCALHPITCLCSIKRRDCCSPTACLVISSRRSDLYRPFPVFFQLSSRYFTQTLTSTASSIQYTRLIRICDSERHRYSMYFQRKGGSHYYPSQTVSPASRALNGSAHVTPLPSQLRG